MATPVLTARPAPEARAVVAQPPARRRRPRRKIPLSVTAPGALLALVALAAVFAPLLAPASPTTGSISGRLLGIGSPGHLLGTDGQGRDILSRLLWGARPSLLAGTIPVAVAAVIGTSLGTVAGLGSRRTHALVMRTLDVFYAFPAVLLAVAIVSSLGAGITSAIIALAVVLIAPVARVVETEVARLRSADFMEAARASGAGWWRIALHQVMPNVVPSVVVYCTALTGLSIVYAGGLSFLGLGLAPPRPEWGLMLNDLRPSLFHEPALALIPAVVIFVVSAAWNILGDGLRDLLDVKREVGA